MGRRLSYCLSPLAEVSYLAIPMFDPSLLIRSQITCAHAALASRDAEDRRSRLEDVYTEARYLRYVIGRHRSLRHGYVPLVSRLALPV